MLTFNTSVGIPAQGGADPCHLEDNLYWIPICVSRWEREGDTSCALSQQLALPCRIKKVLSPETSCYVIHLHVYLCLSLPAQAETYKVYSMMLCTGRQVKRNGFYKDKPCHTKTGNPSCTYMNIQELQFV